MIQLLMVPKQVKLDSGRLYGLLQLEFRHADECAVMELDEPTARHLQRQLTAWLEELDTIRLLRMRDSNAL